MQQHSKNAAYLAGKFREFGLRTIFPGFPDHPGHELLAKMMNDEFGFGGMIAIDLETSERAARFMEMMELEGVGYLAVSLGYFKTLFSNSGKSTSSEVPDEIQRQMGLSEGLVRFSVGLDHRIDVTWQKILHCLNRL